MLKFCKIVLWYLFLFSFPFIFSCGGANNNNNDKTTPENIEPYVSILNPSSNSFHHLRRVIIFEGMAEDSTGKAINGDNLVWTSDLDGIIGTDEKILIKGLSRGIHRITLSATDFKNKTYSDSILISCSKTDVFIESPEDNLVFTEGYPISFSANATDYKKESLSGASFVWKSDKDDFFGEGHSFYSEKLSPGTHTITLTATDDDANKETVSINMSVTTTKVEILSPTHNNYFPLSQPIAFTGSAVDSLGNTIPENRIIWTSDKDQEIGTGISFETSTLSKGHHTISLGIESSGIVHNYTKINIAIGTALAIIEKPKNGSAFLLSEGIQFEAYAVDDTGNPFPENSLEWRSSIDQYLGTGSTLNKTNLSRGKHTIKLTAKDANEHIIAQSDIQCDLSVTKPQWLKLIDYSVKETGQGISVNHENSIFITGTAFRDLIDSPFLFKLDESGHKIWSNEILLNNRYVVFKDTVSLPNGKCFLSSDHNTSKMSSLNWQVLSNDGLIEDQFELSCSRYSSDRSLLDTFALDIDQLNNYYTAYRSCDGVLIFEKRDLDKHSILWQSQPFESYDSLVIKDIKVDLENNLFVMGSTKYNLDGKHPNNIKDSLVVLKLDNTGKKQWIRQYEPNEGVIGKAMVIDDNNDCYVTGMTKGGMNTEPPIGREDIFIVKINSTTGDFNWMSVIGTLGDDCGSGIALSSDGNIVITGHVSGDFNGLKGKGGEDIFLVKYDGQGNLIWSELIGGEHWEKATAIAIDSKGDCILTGITSHGFNGQVTKNRSDAFVLKVQLD